MKQLKIKDTKALYVKRVENALYCDFCEERDVTVLELEDDNETQICSYCIKQLNKIADKLL